LDKRSSQLFDIYLKELLEWNQKFNLTAITDPDEIRKRHFAESLALLPHLSPLTAHASLIDIGPGAGFPGIPIKIARPDLKLTLVEATRKKTEFLKHIVKTLNLKDVEIIWGRAEEVAKTRKGEFDLAVARAVAELKILASYCLPFVKPGGLFVAFKGAKAQTELMAAEKTLKKLGGKLVEITQNPTLIIIKKIMV